MKLFVALFLVGQVATFYILNNANRPVQGSDTQRKISYEEVNEAALKNIAAFINSQKTQSIEPKRETVTTVQGKNAFSDKMANLFAYLKQNQVLYRYELNNSLKTYLDAMESVGTERVESFNTKVNEIIGFHINTIAQTRFSDAVKVQASAYLEEMRNPLQLVTTAQPMPQKHVGPRDLSEVQKALNDIKTTREVVLHSHEVVLPKSPLYPLMALWGAISVLSFFALKGTKTSIKTVEVEAEEQINPTFKRIMSDLDYPMVMVDQGLNIIWQNKKSETFNFETGTLQNIFKTDSQGNEEILVDGGYYSISISELNYKSGKKNYLAQLKPKVTSNKYLEHLVDTSEITSLLESQTSNGSFGDVNQSMAQLSVKLGYLFKVSGKFLDLHFKQDISDCFIESARLEGMLKEFMMGCHYIVKDDSEVQGLYIRTDEVGSKFSVSCFLMNFRKDGLDSHAVTRDFLRRFSILEAKYSICNPSIDFKFKTAGDIKGLDITLNFDNRSELETLMGSVAANA